MAGKTYAELTSAADVQGGDLLATWRSGGPLKSVTANILATFLAGSSAITTLLSGYLLKSNNLSDLASAATARTNLGLGTAATLTAGTGANDAVQLDGSGNMPAVPGDAMTGIRAPDVIVQQQGGSPDTLTRASWSTRTLNTIVRNRGSIASLSTNQITLPAGSYYVRVRAGVSGRDGANTDIFLFATRVFNVTGSAVAVGQGEGMQLGIDVNNKGISGISQTSGVIVLAGSTALRLDTYCGGSGTFNGVGGAGAGTGATDVFSTVEIWKYA